MQKNKKTYTRPNGTVSSWSSTQCARWIRNCVKNGLVGFVTSFHAASRQSERLIDDASVLECIKTGTYLESERENEIRKDGSTTVKLAFVKETKLTNIKVVVGISDIDHNVIVITVINRRLK